MMSKLRGKTVKVAGADETRIVIQKLLNVSNKTGEKLQ